MEGKKEQLMSEGRKPSLEDFQHEIEVLMLNEVSGNKKTGNFLEEGSKELVGHPDFHASDLTEEDMSIWQEPQNGNIEQIEFEAYRDRIAQLNEEGKVPTSRYIKEGTLKPKKNIA
jgi:hypothetical protein